MERDELRYAIWLNPDALCCEYLYPVMAKLRQTLKGPVFAPHLTLVSGIVGEEKDLIHTFQSCAEEQMIFTLHPSGVAISGDFFRAVTVNTTLPQQLHDFRAKVVKRFELTNAKPYHPHLSLAYGEISDEILAPVQADLQQRTWPNMTINSISLWRLRGPVSNWRMVTTASLTG